jgi:hypothetical protein
VDAGLFGTGLILPRSRCAKARFNVFRQAAF